MISWLSWNDYRFCARVRSWLFNILILFLQIKFCTRCRCTILSTNLTSVVPSQKKKENWVTQSISISISSFTKVSVCRCRLRLLGVKAVFFASDVANEAFLHWSRWFPLCFKRWHDKWSHECPKTTSVFAHASSRDRYRYTYVLDCCSWRIVEQFTWIYKKEGGSEDFGWVTIKFTWSPPHPYKALQCSYDRGG